MHLPQKVQPGLDHPSLRGIPAHRVDESIGLLRDHPRLRHREHGGRVENDQVVMLAGRGQEVRELLRAEEIDRGHLSVVGDDQVEPASVIVKDRLAEACLAAQQADHAGLRVDVEIPPEYLAAKVAVDQKDLLAR